MILETGIGYKIMMRRRMTREREADKETGKVRGKQREWVGEVGE